MLEHQLVVATVRHQCKRELVHVSQLSPPKQSPLIPQYDITIGIDSLKDKYRAERIYVYKSDVYMRSAEIDATAARHPAMSHSICEINSPLSDTIHDCIYRPMSSGSFSVFQSFNFFERSAFQRDPAFARSMVGNTSSKTSEYHPTGRP